MTSSSSTASGVNTMKQILSIEMADSFRKRISSLIPEMNLTKSYTELNMILHSSFDFCIRWQIMVLNVELCRISCIDFQQRWIMPMFRETEPLTCVDHLFCFNLRVWRPIGSVDYTYPLRLEVENCSPICLFSFLHPILPLLLFICLNFAVGKSNLLYWVSHKLIFILLLNTYQMENKAHNKLCT